MVGRPAVCSSNRLSASLLQMQREKDGRVETKYIDPGCGKVYTCVNCGKFYQRRRAGRICSITDCLLKSFPKLEIIMIEWTIPHDHEWAINECGSNYNKLFHAVRDSLETIYPGYGSIMILHNWSSKDPAKKHIHIHSITYCIDRKAKNGRAFRDIETVKDIWSAQIETDASPYIHMEYYKKERSKDIFYRILYRYRSPIVDYVKKHGIHLNIDYLMRVSYLYRQHRVRYCGWMGNHTIRQTLYWFGIVPIDKEEGGQWSYVGRVPCYGDWYKGQIMTKKGIALEKSDTISRNFMAKSQQYTNDIHAP